MNYPKNMHEATQAAHEERSKAFFELLAWVGKPIPILLRNSISAIRRVKAPKPGATPKDTCTP